MGLLLPIDDATRIEAGLGLFLQNLGSGVEPVLAPKEAEPYSRVHRAAGFATLFTSMLRP